MTSEGSIPSPAPSRVLGVTVASTPPKRWGQGSNPWGFAIKEPSMEDIWVWDDDEKMFRNIDTDELMEEDAFYDAWNA